MQGRPSFPFTKIVIAFLSTAASICFTALSQTPAAFSIEGTVEKPGDGCNQTVVVLCDLNSGEPLCRGTMQPFTTTMGKTNQDQDTLMDWLFTLTDSAGRFQFTNVPPGNYVVVAQAWQGGSQPTNLLKLHSETVHLLGRKEVQLPSEEAAHLQLASPGTNSIQFNQQFGNDAGFLMLSTRPQFGDPILAWFGWGTNFLSHIIGFNLMPHGKTTIHGLPGEVYASIFMNDNSPGFGSMKLPVGGTNVARMPIVAGWSDGYKVPPTNLVWLVNVLTTNKVNVDQLLGLPRPDRSKSFLESQQEKWRLLKPMWENEITLPTGQKTRVADLIVAEGYARLNGKREN